MENKTKNLTGISEEQKKEIVEEIDQWGEDNDIEPVFIGSEAEEHAYAIVGVVDTPRPAIIYSYRKLVESFMINDYPVHDEDAYTACVEHVEYNVIGSLVSAYNEDERRNKEIEKRNEKRAKEGSDEPMEKKEYSPIIMYDNFVPLMEKE